MTPDEATLKEQFEKQLVRMRVYMRNRKKILRMLPKEEREAYREACKRAWEAGEDPPPFPGGKVSSVEAL
jgi:hypothetical protein